MKINKKTIILYSLFAIITISLAIIIKTVVKDYPVLQNTVEKTIVNNFELMSTIPLEPNSTSVELQEAINNSSTGDIIQISSDMTFLSVVTIPEDKIITIESTPGNTFKIIQTVSQRHFEISGNLTLDNIVLDTIGNDSTTILGGIHINDDAYCTLNNGVVIQNCIGINSPNWGSTGTIQSLGNLVINGAVIKNNLSNFRNYFNVKWNFSN